MATKSLWHRFRLNVNLFIQGAVLSYIALFRWLHPPTYLASKILMPLTQILFFSFVGMYATNSTNATFYVIGNAIHIVAINGIFGVTMSIGEERWVGTLPYLFATPANRLTMFLGRAFVHVFDGILGALIGLLWGVLLLGLDLSKANPATLLLTIVITTFSTCALGLLMGCLSLITLNVMFVNNTVYFLLMIFSGANVPLAQMPGWMQTISWMLPLTRGIASARQIIAGGDFASVAPLLAGEFAIGLVYICLGYSLFRWFEFQAKRRGTLEAI